MSSAALVPALVLTWFRMLDGQQSPLEGPLYIAQQVLAYHGGRKILAECGSNRIGRNGAVQRSGSLTKSRW
jgi:hypothetical protein